MDRNEFHALVSESKGNESNLKVIQTIMGHADIRTTMEIYAEATEESMDEAMDRLSEQLF